jgi:DNA-binding MarR family transcriptional regulator
MSNKSEITPLVSELLCFALYSTNHAMNRAYKPLLKEFGLTYPQYLVLLKLWESDHQLVGALGKALFLESNTLTPMLKRLETAGYVTRKRDKQDERQVRINLTSTGKSLQDKTNCITDQIIETANLNKQSMEKMSEQVTQLRDALLSKNS